MANPVDKATTETVATPPLDDTSLAPASSHPLPKPETTWRRIAKWTSAKENTQNHKADTAREAVETVVFVVALVLLLKAFVAEAFIIPTGSMATTLLGYHRHATCDKCLHSFFVNASEESEGGPPRPHQSLEAICPHCRNRVEMGPKRSKGEPVGPIPFDGGDKVLVLKPTYDFGHPRRHDVIVFKWPGRLLGDGRRDGGPQENFSAKNYIKRLWLLPEEKPSIWYGDVYRRVDVGGKEDRQILRKPPGRLWEMKRLVSDNDSPPLDLIDVLPPRWSDAEGAEGWTSNDQGRSFKIAAGEKERRLRYRNLFRPPGLPINNLQQALQRLNNLQGSLQQSGKATSPVARQLEQQLQPVLAVLRDVESNVLQPPMQFLKDAQPRLQEAMKALDLTSATRRELGNSADVIANDLEGLRTELSNLSKDVATASELALQPQLIVDLLGYNMAFTFNGLGPDRFAQFSRDSSPHWVRDLMLDCEVEVEAAQGQLTLEVNGGVDQCLATFDLSTGKCELKVLRHESPDAPPRVVTTQVADTTMKRQGKHTVQFANFDDRLTLWVNGKRPFGDGVEYESIGFDQRELRGPRPSDLQPVSILAKNTQVQVRGLKIWRDIYYTRDASLGNYPDFNLAGMNMGLMGMSAFLSLSEKERAEMPARAKVDKWYPYYQHDPKDYPQLGLDEFFALGDNSTRSSDSREWGPVPQRLLLGEAVWVYWPLGRFGPIW